MAGSSYSGISTNDETPLADSGAAAASKLGTPVLYTWNLDPQDSDSTVSQKGINWYQSRTNQPKKSPSSLLAAEWLKRAFWSVAFAAAAITKMTVRLVRAPIALGVSLTAFALAVPFAFINGFVHLVSEERSVHRKRGDTMVRFFTNHILGFTDIQDADNEPSGRQIALRVVKKHAIELGLTLTLAAMAATTIVTAGAFVPAAAAALAPVVAAFNTALASFGIGAVALPTTVGLGLGAATLGAAAGIAAAAGTVIGTAVIADLVVESNKDHDQIATEVVKANKSSEYHTSDVLQAKTRKMFSDTFNKVKEDFEALDPNYVQNEQALRYSISNMP